MRGEQICVGVGRFCVCGCVCVCVNKYNSDLIICIFLNIAYMHFERNPYKCINRMSSVSLFYRQFRKNCLVLRCIEC
jgi:hypothetical protein